MGYVYTAIELMNTEEVGLARRNIIQPDEVKRMTVNMLIVHPDHPYYAQIKVK